VEKTRVKSGFVFPIPRHGFCLVARDAVPASVQQSVEFQGV
jgi:hypothetical protein